jgi:hypothetical protein
MISLLDTINATFSRELVRHVASRLGEGENAISKGLAGIVPMVLAGLINKAGAGDAPAVHSLTLEAHLEAKGSLATLTGLLGLLGGGHGPGSALAWGHGVVATLVGPSGRFVTASVSEYAQIKPDSATTLLGLVGVVVPALVSQHAARGLHAAGTTALLLSLKSQVRTQLPAGLAGLTGLMWPGGLNAASRQQSMVAKAGHQLIGMRKALRSPAVALSVVGAAALIFFLMRNNAAVDGGQMAGASTRSVVQAISYFSAWPGATATANNVDQLFL